MTELRWHPLLKQWVGVASHRQDRPQLPKDWCPFCPGSGRVPDHYDVYLYPNDFPAFDLHSEPFHPETGLFARTGAYGSCDVVLYSSNHNLNPSHIPVDQWIKVIDLWTERYHTLAETPGIAYVQIFENSGVAIGVTMPHPHGQIYAFPFVPPQIATEMSSAEEYFGHQGRCLFCDILAGEQEQKVRIVAENNSFVAFCPYFSRWPSEVQLYPRRHFGELQDMTPEEKQDLAAMISVVRQKYDNLYGFLLPLMMLVRQPLSHGEHPYFHFHIEFYPIQRSATKLKYLASVESGTGTFLNDGTAENRAEELRRAAPQT